MSETLSDLQIQLANVNNAIASLVKGEQLVLLEIGSGGTRRKYQYTPLDLDKLESLRSRLLADIGNLDNSTPVFRSAAAHLTRWSKF